MATTTPSTECAICVAPYKDVVSVPCGHVFCLPCLQVYIARSCKDMMAPCPTCRVSFPCVTPDPNLIAKNLQQHIHPSIRKLFIDIRDDNTELAEVNIALAAASVKANALAGGIEKRDKDIDTANRKIEELRRLLGEMNDIRAGKIKAEMQVDALKRKLDAQRGRGGPATVDVKQETDLDLDSKIRHAMSGSLSVAGVKREREPPSTSLEDRIEPLRKIRYGYNSSSSNSTDLRHGDSWSARGSQRPFTTRFRD